MNVSCFLFSAIYCHCLTKTSRFYFKLISVLLSLNDVTPFSCLEWVYSCAKRVVFAFNIIDFACDVYVELVKLRIQIHYAIFEHCNKINDLTIGAYLVRTAADFVLLINICAGNLIWVVACLRTIDTNLGVFEAFLLHILIFCLDLDLLLGLLDSFTGHLISIVCFDLNFLFGLFNSLMCHLNSMVLLPFDKIVQRYFEFIPWYGTIMNGTHLTSLFEKSTVSGGAHLLSRSHILRVSVAQGRSWLFDFFCWSLQCCWLVWLVSMSVAWSESQTTCQSLMRFERSVSGAGGSTSIVTIFNEIWLMNRAVLFTREFVTALVLFSRWCLTALESARFLGSRLKVLLNWTDSSIFGAGISFVLVMTLLSLVVAKHWIAPIVATFWGARKHDSFGAQTSVHFQVLLLSFD